MVKLKDIMTDNLYSLPMGETLSFGRGIDNDLKIPAGNNRVRLYSQEILDAAGNISRVHGEMRANNDGSVRIVDWGRLGTSVDGQKISTKDVFPGQVITIAPDSPNPYHLMVTE